MDIVYGRSRFPLGVISIPIDSQAELDRLENLITLSTEPRVSRYPHRTLNDLEDVVLKIISDPPSHTSSSEFTEEYRDIRRAHRRTHHHIKRISNECDQLCAGLSVYRLSFARKRVAKSQTVQYHAQTVRR